MNQMQMNQMGMNPMQMNQMGMNQMGMNQMGMNPMGMNQMGMNPMVMNQMGMNPMQMNLMGMNQMGMNPMGMNAMQMNPMANLDEIKNMIGEDGINKMNLEIGNTSWMEVMNPMMRKMKLNMMNQQQQNQYKQWLKFIGYKIGKLAAEKKKKDQGINTPSTETNNNIPAATSNDGEITVKFKKGSSITSIKMKANEMVADLINEYFVKSNTNSGTFTFNGRQLKPTDCEELNTVGLSDGSTINVS